MYIGHQHFENSSSGACSNVKVFDTHEGVIDYMFNTIRQSVAHCELETMNKMINFLQTGGKEKTIIDGFTIENRDDEGYFITDKYGEDMYWFNILDVDGGGYESSF